MTLRYPISPRMAAPTSVPAMMTDVLVALFPVVCMSIYLYGFPILMLLLLSVGSCIFFQTVYGLLTHRVYPLYDFSPCVTGLLLALCYPPNMSLWAVPLGSFFAIIVVKELYGGLGCNFLNPALAGRMFLASSPWLMTQFQTPLPLSSSVDALSSATPLVELHHGILPDATLEELFLGFHSSSLGEGSALMLLLGGIYLLLRRVITPTIPLSFLGTVAFLSYCFPPTNVDPLVWMFAQLFSGGLMLGAIFLATDPVTSPVSFQSQLAFGIGCGSLTMLLRTYGSYPEGVGFAILTMNGLVWLLDYLGAPHRLGAGVFDEYGETLFEVGVRLDNIKVEKIHLSLPLLLSSQSDKTKKNTVFGERYLDKIPHTLKNSLVYGVILLITVSAIRWTHSTTQLQLYRNTETDYQVLLSQAMPNADFMSETPYTHPSFHKLYAAYEDQELLGYCVHVSSAGFVGDLHLLVGIGLDGAVTGIAVLEHNETIHLGTEVLTPSALSVFKGRSGTLSLEGANAIDGMSGATVTLDAVVECVNQALLVGQLIHQVGALDELSGVL